MLRLSSSLAGLLLLAGCADRAPPLQPIPAPMMPATISVPVLVRLPAEMTKPCEPAAVLDGGINTDADGSIMAAREHVVSECNAAKLRAIQAAQP